MAYELIDDGGQKVGRFELVDETPTVVKAGNVLNDIPRQLGLTARYAIEGPARAAELVTEPLRYVTDRLTGQTGKTKPLGAVASGLADSIGLPMPQNATERVVGDATRLGFGTIGGLGILRSGGAPAALTANPTQQVGGAVGAGLAGGSSREAGGGPWQQAAASLLGGVTGSLTPGAISLGANAVRSALPRAPLSSADLDVRIEGLLRSQGVDFSQLSQSARESMRRDVGAALRTGDMLDETSVARLASFRNSGLTPTRGMISQNPVDITREQNLAKTAANMGNTEAHALPMLQNRNNAAMIGRLNELGAGAGVLPEQAGQRVVGAVTARDAANTAAERAAWNTARNSPGFTQPIYPDALSNINRALGDEALMPFMSPGVSRYIEALQTTPGQFTPQAYANLRSMLSAELAKGGNEARAARSAINALEASPMRPITQAARDLGQAPTTADMAGLLRSADQQAGNSLSAIDAARQATAAKYGYQDSNSLVRSALSDARSADPQRIAQSFIVNGTAEDARMVAQQVGPQGQEVIKNALANEIKRRALSDASDETGKVSATALNRAIKSIGEDKLRVFFSTEELQRLRDLNRATSLAMSQPAGSAVNNSNSGALVIGKAMDALRGSGNLPVIGPMITAPLANGISALQVSIGNRAAQNVIPGLLQAQPMRGAGLLGPMVVPTGVVSGGLLSSP